MLHYDKSTQEYFRALEQNYSNDTTTNLEVAWGIKQEVNKVFEAIEYDWKDHYHRVEKGMHSFHNKLTKVLSHQIPARYVGRRRPASHKLPYRNSGELVDSLSYTVNQSTISSDNRYTITVELDTNSQHAHWTNENWTPAGHNQRSVHWFHWVDNILGSALPTGQLHKAGIPDLRAILIGYYS